MHWFSKALLKWIAFAFWKVQRRPFVFHSPLSNQHWIWGEQWRSEKVKRELIKLIEVWLMFGSCRWRWKKEENPQQLDRKWMVYHNNVLIMSKSNHLHQSFETTFKNMTAFCAAADWVSFKVEHKGLFDWLREVSTGLSSAAERDQPRFCGTPINCREMIKLIFLSVAFILWLSGVAFSRFLQVNAENLKNHFHWNYDGLLKLGHLCNIWELLLHCGTCWPC